MKKSLFLTAAAVLALSSPAFAGNDNGPKGGDSSANAGAVAGAAAGAVSGSSSNAVGGGAIVTGNNNGGDGGNASSSATGGAGGRADASSSSSLGSLNKFGGDAAVVGSGNSSNTNLLGQVQGQGQVASSDQSQGQSLSNTNSLSQGNTQTVGGQQATNTTNVDASDRSVTTYEAQKRAPVNTAYAAPLAIGSGSCMYTPASGGVSGIALSVSGSFAKRDDECERRSYADVLARLGDVNAARALLANNAEVAAAYSSAGYGGAAPVAESAPAPKAAAPEAPAAFSFTPMQPIPNPKTPRGE